MKKDDAWFESVYTRFYVDIYRLAFSYVRRKEVAEDVSQDVFLKFYLHPPRSEKNIKSFLMMSARNKSIDVIRKEKREKKLQEEYAKNQAEEPSSSKCDNSDLVLEALSKIPKKYADILRMFYYANLSTKEIAHMIHLSEETVRKRLQRGRESLKSILEGNN